MNEVWVRRPWDAEPWFWGGYASVIHAQDDYERTVEAHPDWDVEFRSAVPVAAGPTTSKETR